MDDGGARRPELWVAPVLAMLLLQAAGAFLMQLPPVLAPVLSADFGWSRTFVGYIATTSMIGALAFLVAGAPLARATGPIRSVQLGLVLGALGIFVLPLPIAAAPVAAGFLMGLAYGPTMPAGSQVLQRYAPPRHRSLIFSVKQAGVPIGGALAGLLLPAVAAAAGWRGALIVAAVVVLAAVVVAQPVRNRIDGDPEVSPRRPFRPAQEGWGSVLATPLASLRSSRELQKLAVVGGCVGLNQGGWNAFFVTYLVVQLDFSLPAAGALFAVMQISAVAGRLALGWVADRLGSGRAVLRAAAVASGLTSVALVSIASPQGYWAIAALAAVAGTTVTGWNGIHLAELARRAPPGLVGEVSAGGMILVSLGLLLGPSAFAAILAATGSFAAAFLALATVPLAASLLIFGPESVPAPASGSG